MDQRREAPRESAFVGGPICDRELRVFVLRLSSRPLAIVAAAAVLAVAFPTFGQLLRPPTDPQNLQQPRKSPMTLTPSVTVSEEFNDNVFLDNTRKEWDMITRITPGVTFEVGEPTYRLAAGYFFTADLYARHPELNQAFDAHSFIGDAVWKASPLLTLNAFDTFTLTTDTNLMNQESVATGRNRSYSNYMGGGASYQVDPRTTVRGGALWVVQHFQSEDLFDPAPSALYPAADRASPPRFPGPIGYQYRFFDIQTPPDTTTHTPRLGVRFRFTETKNRYSYPMVPVNRGVNARSTARSRPYVSESKRSSLWKCWTTQSAPPRTVVRGST